MSDPVVLFINLRSSHLEHRAAIEAAYRQGYGVAVFADSIPRSLPQRSVWASHQVDVDDAAALDMAVDATAKKHPIAGVVAWSDAGVEAAGRCAARLGLPGPSASAARTARNKYLMRSALAHRPDLMPRFAEVVSWEDARKAADEIGFPAVLKPTSGSGSKGIFRLSCEADLSPAFTELTGYVRPAVNKVFRQYPGQLIYEEFLDGTEHSVEGFVHQGQLFVAGITDKQTTEPFRLELAHVHPSALGGNTVDAVHDLTGVVVKSLGLDNCAFHLECIVGPLGVKLVEIAARVGGDYITSHLVRLATGTSFYENVIRVATGQPPVLPHQPTLHAGSYKIISPRAGTLAGLGGLAGALSTPGLQHLVIERSVGAKVRLPPEHYSSCILGTLIAVDDSHDAVWRTLEDAAAAVQVNILE